MFKTSQIAPVPSPEELGESLEELGASPESRGILTEALGESPENLGTFPAGLGKALKGCLLLLHNPEIF